MNNLANSYASLHRPADAVRLHEETLAIRRRVLSSDHPHTLQSIVNLANCLIQLDRGAAALPLIDEAIARAGSSPAVHPGLIPYAVILRWKHFRKIGDAAGCRAAAETWEKFGRADADGLYLAAGIWAVAAGVQAKAPGADAARLSKDDAERAMAWMTKAVAAGFKDAAYMRKDPDLDPLRDRDDFKKLVAALEKNRPSKPKFLPGKSSP